MPFNKKAVFSITLILLLLFAYSHAQTASSTSSSSTASSSERVKALLDPFSIINNIGYDNSYYSLYNAGKIKTPPPFGGPVINMIQGCFDGVTWVSIGLPRPGWYVHQAGVTRTYAFGPPRHIGQFILGLYAPKHFCAKNTGAGLIVKAGFLITMMGSSR